MWRQGAREKFGFSTYSMNNGFTAWKYGRLPPLAMTRQPLAMLGKMLGYAEWREAAPCVSMEKEIDMFVK
jgi:hypothetical protein